ncbi:hypothetical protein AB5N19_12157 [Seiridium cardinale]
MVERATDHLPIEEQHHHPYYPLGLVLPGYVPNDISVPTLISSFAAASIYVFVFDGLRFFAYNNADMPARASLFGRLWKEYALSDRRYLTRDLFVVCMETVTAFCWGPLSFVVGWYIIKRNSFRHLLQLVVSLGQLYGDVLYYATFFFEEPVFGEVFCRPERYYSWAYLVLLDGFWIVIPVKLCVQSILETGRAFAQLQVNKKQSEDRKSV